MKCVVIAAGYATRLGELTKNFPKPLLKIGANTILGRMLDDIDRIPEIDEHIIITNHKFAPIFEEWIKANTDLTDNTDKNQSVQSEQSVVRYMKPITAGNLAHYMVEHTTMHAWPMSAGRFDIGSLDTYYEAVKRFG